MKSINVKKSAIILGVTLASALFVSDVNAYERYTWSDLVTGRSRNGSASDEDKLAVVCEWCGLKRIVRSQITDATKMKNAHFGIKISLYTRIERICCILRMM